MTQRMIAPVMTLGVAVATVTSALAPAGSAPAPQAPAVVKKVETRPDPPPGTAKAAKVPRAPRAAVQKVNVAAPAQRQVIFAAPMAPGFNVDSQLQQIRPVLRAEYHIVRAVCHPTPEQRKELGRDAERILRESARKYVEAMNRPMTAAQRAALEPRKQIREGLADSVKARLSGEMAARYREEIARREASRKQLAIRNLIARLDRDLILTRDQREKLEESLTAHWDDSWCTSIQMFMYDNQFLPPISDQYVAPFLNDAQRVIWRGTQKFFGSWGGFEMMGGIRIDDPLEDEELRAARLEAARNDPRPDPNQQPNPAVMIHDVRIQMAPAVRIMAPTATKKAQATAGDAKKMPEPAKAKAIPK